MKSAGKARNNGLYRHIRTSKEIIRNLLNDWYKILSLNFVQNDGGKTKKKNVKRERLLSHALTFFLVCGDYSSGRAKTSSLTS